LHILILGTHNRKKGEELAELLLPHGVTLRTLADYPESIEVVEDGETFAANAAKKATQQAKHLGQWVLAEDSGLSVDALKGSPGIYSARFSGDNATDQQNNDHLLEQLGNLPLERRTAHYTCHATLADPQGTIRAEHEAYCHGRIRFKPAGNEGFGYDPLFEIREYHQTFAQLGPAVKSILSHRAKAMRQILPTLLDLGTKTDG